jgi:hypothetical protein
MRIVFALVLIVVISFSAAELQAQSGTVAQQFLLNHERNFTYLQFDHIGKGTRFNENEPTYRIWLRLANNCRVPIVIRTFGVPDGSPRDEVGLIHNVVADPVLSGVASGISFESGASPKPVESPATPGQMPDGYDAEVSSAATLESSETLLFSIPFNHLSSKWHIEIPFRFELPHKRPSHYEANIGGQPLMVITYSLSDLPTDARHQIETAAK